MEYLSYILITVGILVLCVLLLRGREPVRVHELDSRLLKNKPAASPAKQAAKNENPKGLLSAEAALRREQQKMSVPWGWPGHEGRVPVNGQKPLNAEEVHGVSESLHRFVDRLMTEKQTVNSQEYLLKKDASLRALIEDRYGRTLVVNGSGRKTPEEADPTDDDQKIKFEPLRELKTPWGW